MGFKKMLKKVAKDMKEANKPENVEARLKEKIKIEELKEKLDAIKDKKRKRAEQKQGKGKGKEKVKEWSIGGERIKW